MFYSSCTKVKQNAKLIMNIRLQGIKLEEVNLLCYLGSMIKKDSYNSSIGIEIGKNFLKTYIWNVTLYGCEKWIEYKEEKQQIKAFIM